MKTQKAQGIIEYALIMVLVAIFVIVTLAVLAPAFPGNDTTISGQITKTYTLGCQNCSFGYAVVHPASGADVSVELYAQAYGLVNVGDVCTFKVGSTNRVHSLSCRPAKDR